MVRNEMILRPLSLTIQKYWVACTTVNYNGKFDSPLCGSTLCALRCLFEHRNESVYVMTALRREYTRSSGGYVRFGLVRSDSLMRGSAFAVRNTMRGSFSQARIR